MARIIHIYDYFDGPIEGIAKRSNSSLFYFRSFFEDELDDYSKQYHVREIVPGELGGLENQFIDLCMGKKVGRNCIIDIYNVLRNLLSEDASNTRRVVPTISCKKPGSCGNFEFEIPEDDLLSSPNDGGKHSHEHEL